MRRFFCICALLFSVVVTAVSQVDTTFVYNTNTNFGILDLRLSKGYGHSYYLQEGKTFSFRTHALGPTNTFLDMTAWDSRAYTQGNMRQRGEGKDLFAMNYRLLAPQNYDVGFSRGYPLVVVMHGLLERGNCADGDCYHADKSFSPNENRPSAPTEANHKLLNNDYSLVHAGVDYLEASVVNGMRLPDDANLPAMGFPGFVLFPQNLNGWDAAACEDVIRLIRLMMKKYNIDEDRVYINGISHGGHGAYEVMKRAPWLFAAAVQFSAADDGSIINQKATERIAAIPLWIFQGGLDENPSPSKTESYIRAFRRSGQDVRYTFYPHLGHGTWNEALDEPDFFAWLLSKKRNNIHVDGGKAFICSTTKRGALLSLPDGFKGYEWELNGGLIPEASANTYSAERPGIYRARFLSGEHPDGWSTWSEEVNVTVLTPESPQINQIGTLLLPDLNGNQFARLEADGDYLIYTWQRNAESLKEIPDTVKAVSLEPHLGSAAYSLTVSGYDLCPSEPSLSKRVLFNDEAPLALPAPVDFEGTPVSPSESSLSWSYASGFPVRFEVWRRSRDAHGNFSPWVMPVITDPNIVSYRDKGLNPEVTYYYKIRAVTDSSRSNYFPEGSNALVLTTPPDDEPPTAPAKLTAGNAGVNALRLSWQSSFDNSSISGYLIIFSGDSVLTHSADTTFLLETLTVNTDYSVTVRALDQSGNVSPASNAIHATTYMTGLYYEHSTGAWEDIAAIDWSLAEFSGTVDDFTLSPKTQDDFFNFMFDGFLFVETPGVYQFRITSDDGSTLNLNDTLLIANDGIHNINTVTGPVQVLDAGPQRITVKYFDYNLSDTLLVEYKGPDSHNEWTKIPPQVLTSELVTSVASPDQETFRFDVFPNPVSYNNINLEISSDNSDPLTIRISDITGRTIFYADQTFNEKVEIEALQSLEGGIYFLSVAQGHRRMTKRIVIQ